MLQVLSSSAAARMSRVLLLQRIDPFTGGVDGHRGLIHPQIKGAISFCVCLFVFLCFAQATRCAPLLLPPVRLDSSHKSTSAVGQKPIHQSTWANAGMSVGSPLRHSAHLCKMRLMETSTKKLYHKDNACDLLTHHACLCAFTLGLKSRPSLDAYAPFRQGCSCQNHSSCSAQWPASTAAFNAYQLRFHEELAPSSLCSTNCWLSWALQHLPGLQRGRGTELGPCLLGFVQMTHKKQAASHQTHEPFQ